MPAATSSSDVNIWAIVPAAGCGSRMRSATPKQYLDLSGRPVIEHTLAALFAVPRITGIVVAVADGDVTWPNIAGCFSDRRLEQVSGGAERCHSVLNALEHLSATASGRDWVLVHDAARPCVRLHDIDKLIYELKEHPVGGILAVPVHDTIKRGSLAAEIVETVDRRDLWQAQTPQMFRLESLRNALQHAIEDGFLVTDEASAMEHLGLKPKLVEGHADNIKVTRPEDLPLAEFHLQTLYQQTQENN
jgi:2-C-methyl-D-erythritol 4-phosphate cytidylyltransferase